MSKESKSLLNSRSQTIEKPSKRSHLVDGGKIYHEDPTAKLNINESEWNKIVQDNLKKYEEDKVNAK